MTTTTSHFQSKPDYYNSIEECSEEYKIKQQTNLRYRNFNQTHFTVGDEEQFQHYRYDKNLIISNKNISLESNIFNKLDIEYWNKYNNLEAINVLETFRYLFNKFKKGIFVKIVNNELKVFLPFSNVNFVNEWSHNIKVDPKYKSFNDFFNYISNMEGRTFNKNNTNDFINSWYGNNYLVRYEYPIKESDTNISCIKNMLEELCLNRELPDIEFFINRRDFPLLTKDGTEPYYHLWNSKEQELVSHNYEKYVPILSMSNSENFADVLIPTHEDWARVQLKDKKYFPKSHINFEYNFNNNWNSKKSIAVFRGSSTGYGTDIQTNQRLKVSYMSYLENEINKIKEPNLDAGITKWNVRPRKFMNSEYLQTIDINNLPFGLVEKLTPEEQSNYKYIIHIDGHVSAFRLSYELNMNSVILLVKNEWKIWYSDMLIPFEHYVPVKEDLSDLIEKINWCKNNDDKCKKIASNAKQFYNMYLTKDSIFDYMQKTLVDLKKHTGNYFYNFDKPIDLQSNSEYNFLKNLKEYPKTFKKFNKNSELPCVSRCYGLLKGIQYTLNTLDNFKNYSTFIKEIFNNKLGIIEQYDFLGMKFSLKRTTDTNKIKEHIHESFVGNTSINELLKQIPNFVYTFNFIEENNQITLVNEYIHGLTLQDYITSEDFNIDEFIFILLQICLALHVAQKKFLFVHNDLTPWNIIIQKIKNPIDVEYIIDHEKVLKIKTNIIPVIIDYGKSHIVYDNVHYGFINMFKFSTCTDIITLLITSLYQIITEKKLSRYDFNMVLKLSNFISDSDYYKGQFTNIKELKSFLHNAKKYSNLIVENKGDLESKTPLQFYKYIYKNTRHKYNIEKTNQYNNLFFKADSIQVFDYILSKNIKERNSTVKNILLSLKEQLLSFDMKDEILTHYMFENIRLCLNIYKHDDQDLIIEIKSLLNAKPKKLKIIKVLPKEYNNYFYFNEDFFLNPEKVYTNLKHDYKYNDISEYKEILEYILLVSNTSTKEKYRKNEYLSKVLDIDILKLKLYNTSYNTIKKYSTDIYKSNIKNIKSISDETLNIYNKIFNKI